MDHNIICPVTSHFTFSSVYLPFFIYFLTLLAVTQICMIALSDMRIHLPKLSWSSSAPDLAELFSHIPPLKDWRVNEGHVLCLDATSHLRNT
jgi:hypothetical protein